MEASSCDGWHDSATNWRIAVGSLVDSVAFESSFSSAAADHGSLDENACAPNAPAAKSPLVLLPPSPDCDPCEITITFAQIHEVRQIYIRSTARVYEIYYRTRLHRSNEYLCTVRCGIAERDEEVLQVPDNEATASVNPQEPIQNPEGRRIKDNGNGGTNEDDWVEVKASDASLLNNGKNLPVKPEGRTQDLYEATAEISDVEPCISITLRLLSLQDKGRLFVDEVYVFADPVDPTDSEKEPSGAENSATGSLMAMFMPTLLQLSKARERHKQASDVHESKARETWINPKASAKNMNQIQQEAELNRTNDREVDLPAVVCATVKPAELETSLQVSGAESKPASSCNHVEIILHQLVSRVSRIETMLTRFEDQLLKPINSIDARLQLVEQKLEGLANKSNEFEGQVAGSRTVDPDFPGDNTDRNPDIGSDKPTEESWNLRFPSFNRIVAPEFPCLDVDPDNSDGNKSENYDVESSDLSDGISVPNSSDNLVDPQSVSHSLPGTYVTAAESEIDDDKEGNHSSGGEPSEEKPKHLSINDALASALAGFLTSSSTKDIKYSQALVVTAPEFSNEEDGENDKKILMDAHPDKSQVTSASLAATETAVYIKDLEDSESTLIRSTSVENGTKDTVVIEKEMVDGVAKKFNDDEVGDDDANTVVIDGNTGLDGERTAKTDSAQFIKVTEKESVKHQKIKDPVADEPEHSDVSTGSLVGNDSVAMQKRIISSGFAAIAGGKEEPKTNNVLQSILGFQHAASSVDFETPVLDVKFKSEETYNGKYFFEALLSDLPESSTESDAITEHIDNTSEHNLISVDDGELRGPPTDTLSSLDMNYRDTSYMPLNSGVESQPNFHRSSGEDMPIGSLI